MLNVNKPELCDVYCNDFPVISFSKPKMFALHFYVVHVREPPLPCGEFPKYLPANKTWKVSYILDTPEKLKK